MPPYLLRDIHDVAHIPLLCIQEHRPAIHHTTPRHAPECEPPIFSGHKKVYRLYREADLAVRRRKKAKRPPLERRSLAIAPNAIWSMDFVSDAPASGRRLKCLTVADDFSHECVDIAVDHALRKPVNSLAGKAEVR